MFENMSVRETELNQVIIVDKIPDFASICHYSKRDIEKQVDRL